jgi:chromosome segregation ATPase
LKDNKNSLSSDNRKLNNEIRSLKNELISLKKIKEDIEKETRDLKSKISKLEKEKKKVDNENNSLKDTIEKLNIEITELRNELSESKNEIQKDIKEIISLKEIINKNKEDIDGLNAELDQYENETKAMDKEIQVLRQKISELNLIIEEYESQKGIKKDKNEKFCDLFSSFSKKTLIKHKIDMIIGMYLKKYEDEMEVKYNKFLEKEKILKKRIADLTGELHMIKYGKKMASSVEEYQNNNNVEEITPQSDGENENKIAIYDGNNGIKSLQKIISNRADSQGITRIVDVGTVTKEIGNAVITTKTTQISYKRRRVADGQQ